jgi:aminoglycoside 2'-N-acetyltransferase I
LYTRLGWERWRGPLFIRTAERLLATPGETVMIHRLATTPALSLDDSLSAEWREGDLW